MRIELIAGYYIIIQIGGKNVVAVGVPSISDGWTDARS